VSRTVTQKKKERKKKEKRKKGTIQAHISQSCVGLALRCIAAATLPGADV
jgi:hypothetical protein